MTVSCRRRKVAHSYLGTILALNKSSCHDGRSRAQEGYRALFTKIPQWEKWHALATQRVQWDACSGGVDDAVLR
jgi:hypothetical protein